MTPGPKALREWIDRRKLSDQDAAAEINITPAQLSQILSGKRRPGLDVALRIDTATGVPARSWVPSEVSKAATRRSGKADKAHV